MNWGDEENIMLEAAIMIAAESLIDEVYGLLVPYESDFQSEYYESVYNLLGASFPYIKWIGWEINGRMCVSPAGELTEEQRLYYVLKYL